MERLDVKRLAFVLERGMPTTGGGEEGGWESRLKSVLRGWIERVG